MSIYERLKKDYKLAVRGELGYKGEDVPERLTGEKQKRAHDPDFLRRTLEECKNDLQRLGFRLCVLLDGDIDSLIYRVFNPEAIRMFVELEKVDRQIEFYGMLNQRVYVKLVKFREYVESDKPVDRELLLATQRRMKDFESWFIRHGFERPELVEIIADDVKEKSQVLSDEKAGTEFRHSDKYRMIIFKGTEYHTTPTQAKAIEILDKARTPLESERILSGIYGPASGNKTVRGIFGQKIGGEKVMSPLWGTLVVKVRNKLYGLAAYSDEVTSESL